MGVLVAVLSCCGVLVAVIPCLGVFVGGTDVPVGGSAVFVGKTVDTGVAVLSQVGRVNVSCKPSGRL